jgi:hypothetical protein
VASLSGYDQCPIEDKNEVHAIMDGMSHTYSHFIESNAGCHDNLGFVMSLPMVQDNVDCMLLQSMTSYSC